jgi:hypothetical protein
MKEKKNPTPKRKCCSSNAIIESAVHPHFFQHINNIYSYTQNTSTVASQLVDGPVGYVALYVYECNQPLIAACQKLKMLKDYIT